MANRFDEMQAAIAEAKGIMSAADQVADRMAEMLIGRLRKVSGSALESIKRELRHFNMRTHRWSKR